MVTTFTTTLYKSNRPERISFGNKRLLIWDINNAPAAATTTTMGGFNRIEAIHATNLTDSSDTFLEKIGSHGAATTKKQIILDPVTADDDGHIWLWGR